MKKKRQDNFYIPAKMLPDYIRLSAISEIKSEVLPFRFIDDKLLDDAFHFFLYDYLDAIRCLMEKSTSNPPERDQFTNQWPTFFPNAYPSDPDHLFSSNSIKMLKRYAVFSYLFAHNKTVIDSCCGLGWGSFLLAQQAAKVYALDNHIPSIDFARLSFAETKNITWLVDDAIKLKEFKKNANTHVDLVIACETLEHFNKKDGVIYLKSLFDSLKPGGILCGTTLLFNTNLDAQSSNYYRSISSHLYAWTFSELENELKKYSEDFKIWKNWMFFAKKSN